MRKPPHFSNLKLHAFFISNTFISHVSLKLPKNQANGKQHPDAELLFENYSHSSSLLLSKNRIYSKNRAKEHLCLYSWDDAINHNENEDENEK